MILFIVFFNHINSLSAYGHPHCSIRACPLLVITYWGAASQAHTNRQSTVDFDKIRVDDIGAMYMAP